MIKLEVFLVGENRFHFQAFLLIDALSLSSDLFSDEKLSPKELINKYQLDKSHIAFTLCTKLSKDRYQIHPETTVISSVIAETPAKPTTTTTTAAVAKAENTSSRIINLDQILGRTNDI